MSIEISLTKNNTKEIEQELETKILKALVSCGLIAEGYAKGLCAHDTGLLRNSITYCISGQTPAVTSYRDDKGAKSGNYSGTADEDGEMAVYIGTNVEYAPFIEYGTGKHYSSGRKSKWTYKAKDGFKSTKGGRPQPFIRPAISDHINEYKRVIETELKS